MHVLVTAGATRNPIDAMRHISANSSGRTGVQLARAWADAGCEVHLLGSPEAVVRGEGLSTEVFGSTRDLMARMERWVREHPDGAVVHASAVGDYEVASSADTKIPSGRDEVVIRLTPTPKIANAVRDWGLTGPYVTFKAASPETDADGLIALATKQRARTGSDLVFANVLGRIATDVALVGDEVRWFAARDDAMHALVSWLTSER
ncbi:MAG: hypothetical protein EP330_03890 [Deltaproteobacteria bacterium]|nr:MAG: hypothetical protein EP330_03890 [Deltaproteobacteria bacterium]